MDNIEWHDKRTIAEVQQDFANSFTLDGQNIMNDLLTKDQGDELKNKINSIFPEDCSNNANNANNANIHKMRETLFNSVWAQRKYTNGNLLSTIIYTLVTKETNLIEAKNATSFTCHPVFVTRRCHNSSILDNRNTLNCCKIFVDENGRVYQNFKCYLEENVLPEGTMVIPARGVYTMDNNKKVKLCICSTPQSSLSKQILKFADNSASTLAGVSAIATIGALVLPVFGRIMPLVNTVVIAAVAYSAARSTSELSDRSDHEQSINLSNREARNDWLNVAAGCVGLGASASTTILSRAAVNGKNISNVTKVVANGLNVTSIVLSASGVGNGAFDLFLKFQDNEKITVLNIAQFSASLVVFTHSVYNFKMASQIIDKSKKINIKSYRETITNTIRKTFNKLSNQMMSINGGQQGNFDIIRLFNETPSTKELVKQVKCISKLFRLKTKSDKIYIQQNKPHFSKKILKTSLEVGYFYVSKNLKRIIAINLRNKVLEKINSQKNFGDILASIFENIEESVFDFIVDVLNHFINSILKDIEIDIQIPISSESVLLRILKYLPELENYGGDKKQKILYRLKGYYNSLNPINRGVAYYCPHCPGVFSKIDL